MRWCVTNMHYTAVELLKAKCSYCSTLPEEVRLVNYLLNKYKTMGTVARPMYNSSKLMKIQFGMRLIQMDIIEKEQVLKTSVWIRAVSMF